MLEIVNQTMQLMDHSGRPIETARLQAITQLSVEVRPAQRPVWMAEGRVDAGHESAPTRLYN